MPFVTRSSPRIRNVRFTRVNATAPAVVRSSAYRPAPPGRPLPQGQSPNIIRRRPTATLTVQKKKKEVSGQNSEFTAKRVTYGSKPKNNFRNLARFVHQNVSRTVYGLHNVSRFGGSGGSMPLGQVQTALGAVLTAPLHAYELTGAVNSVNGIITAPTTAWQLEFSNETTSAVASWKTLSQNLSTEYSPNTTTLVQNYPGAVVSDARRNAAVAAVELPAVVEV